MYADFEEFEHFEHLEHLEQALNGYGTQLFPNPNSRFTETYRCYSVTCMSGNERENVNYGGKIILPPTALAKLAGLNIEYPMLFELCNTSKQRRTHAGVLEFIAEEGRAYLPYWMMRTLSLDQGDLIEIKNTTLPLGTFVKIQPQSIDFLDISDQKAVLENAFRNFSTLTQGDNIEINYNNKIYEISVLEVKPSNGPSNGISIVETDLEVDFAPPVGYIEPKQQLPSMAPKIKIENHAKKFSAFRGNGRRLKEKSVQSSSSIASSSKSSNEKSDISEHGEHDNIPAALNLPFGKLFFGYKIVPLQEDKPVENEQTLLFKGEGQRLRPSKKK